jgi:L,D-transpeptidase catalytic domain
MLRPFILSALALPLLVSLSSCGVSGSRAVKAYQAYDVPTQLPENPSRVSVKVSLAAQRVYVKEGDKMLLAMPVSVGAPGSRTPIGNYNIFRKVHHHRANTHGYAYRGGAVKQTRIGGVPAGWSFTGTPMPYWCEFKPNYGFHTGWVKHHPCTHGCIRMHENLSPKFFRLVKVGTPVNIAYSQPEDATHGNIPLPPDSGPLPDYPGSTYVGDGYFTRHKPPSYN